MQESMRWFKSSEKYGYLIKNFNQKYTFLKSEDGFVMDVKTNSYGHRYDKYDQNKLSNYNTKKLCFWVILSFLGTVLI